MSDNPMTILVVEPLKAPYVKEIDGSLAEMQKIVGGAIEGSYPFDDSAAIVCNQEGKLEELPPNRMLTSPDGIPYDIIHGTFFVAGLGAEDFESLTAEQVLRYREMFRLPDREITHKAHKKEKGDHHER